MSCTNSKGLCGDIKHPAVAFAEGSTGHREGHVHLPTTFPIRFFLEGVIISISYF